MHHPFRLVPLVVLAALSMGCLLMGPSDGADCHLEPTVTLEPDTPCIVVEDDTNVPDCDDEDRHALRIRNECAEEIAVPESPLHDASRTIAPGNEGWYELGASGRFAVARGGATIHVTVQY